MRRFGQDDDAIAEASAEVRARFAENVKAGAAECRLFQRHGKTGYAYFQWAKNKSAPAHRVALLWHDTERVRGMYACHTCTQKNCVNPKHLYWGTPKDNMADCIRSGDFKRSRARGMANKFASLTEAQVLDIAARCQNTSKAYTAIGAEFGVSGQCVRHIDKQLTWEHLERPPSNRAVSKSISEATAFSIVSSLKDGRTVPETALSHRVSLDVVGRIARGKTWRHLSRGRIETLDGRRRRVGAILIVG